MHKEAVHFIKYITEIFCSYFNNKIVIDIGGGDINGNNRMHFSNCEYYCNDVTPSANVNIVSRTKDIEMPNDYFDTIISTECFEHDPEYIESLTKIYKMLKPNGLFVFTCASTGRPEHGTRQFKPHQSFGTIHDIIDMRDYYKNLTECDIDKVLSLKENFLIFKTYYNTFSKDLYFVGIKKGNNMFNDTTIDYKSEFVVETSNNI